MLFFIDQFHVADTADRGRPVPVSVYIVYFKPGNLSHQVNRFIGMHKYFFLPGIQLILYEPLLQAVRFPCLGKHAQSR
jgi:hypothetical protein